MRRSNPERMGETMHKALALGLAGITIAFVAGGGCGSTVTDATANDGGVDAAPRGCPMSFGPNDPPCDQPGLVCPGPPLSCPPYSCCPASIMTCGSDGRWVGSTRPRICPDYCPPRFPADGDPCDGLAYRCPEPSPPCASECECTARVATCVNGTWTVVDEWPKPPSCFTDGGRDAATSDASGDSG